MMKKNKVRKLKKAEKKLLKEFPDDIELDSDKILRGTLYPEKWPKNTNVKTLENLHKLELIRHGFLNYYRCPFEITEKGREILNMLNGETKSEGIESET